MRPYQKLIVWQEAHSLCCTVYKLTKSFPSDERFRLVDQMCRASSSVPTNIAEGAAKYTPNDSARYYAIAKGSLEELHYHTLLAFDLGYLTKATFDHIDDHINRVSYLLVKLRKAAKKSTSQT